MKEMESHAIAEEDKNVSEEKNPFVIKEKEALTANQKEENDLTANKSTLNNSTANQKEVGDPAANQKEEGDPTANQKEVSDPTANQKEASDPTANRIEATESKANQKEANASKANQKEANESKANQKERNDSMTSHTSSSYIINEQNDEQNDLQCNNGNTNNTNSTNTAEVDRTENNEKTKEIANTNQIREQKQTSNHIREQKQPTTNQIRIYPRENEHKEMNNSIELYHKIERIQIKKQIYKNQKAERSEKTFENSEVKYLGYQKLTQEDIDIMVDRLAQCKPIAEPPARERSKERELLSANTRENIVSESIRRLTKENKKYIADNKRSGIEVYNEGGVFTSYAAAGGLHQIKTDRKQQIR